MGTKALIERQHLTDIANAIRSKGITGTMKPSEMAERIRAIEEYTEIDVSSDGIVAIPSGSVSAKIKKLLGKSIVESGELKSVEVSKLLINGKNLFDVNAESEYVEGWEYRTNAYVYRFKLKPSTAYTVSSNVPYETSTSLYFNSGSGDIYINAPRTLNTDSGGNISIAIADSRPHTAELINGTYWIQLEEGATATEYAPCHEPIEYHISFNGKSAGTVRDELDLVNKKYIQRVGVVDLGTLSWGRISISGNYIFRQNSGYLPSIGRTGLCERYEVLNNVSGIPSADKSIVISSKYWDSNNRLTIRDDDYTDGTSLKAALQGIMLFYELAEPIITDITGGQLNVVVEGESTIAFDTELDIGSIFTFKVRET